MDEQAEGERAPRPQGDVEAQRSRAALERDLERLSARIEALERRNSELEGFAALAAHEMLEPLIMAEAFAAMVSERLPANEYADSRADLAALGRGAARVRVLVEALLYDARAHRGTVPSGPVDLNAVVDECLTMLGREIAAREADVRVAELPEVWGERASLTSVFANLLVNALKYSPRRGSHIRVASEREQGAWRIAVHSEGPTIPAEERERIFEPFHRARGERRVRGAGLGLAICRRIIERHGGEIGVAPGDAGGNVFHFTLPA